MGRPGRTAGGVRRHGCPRSGAGDGGDGFIGGPRGAGWYVHQEVSLRIGLLTEKELDLLGVSCCDSDGFAEAVGIAERRQAELSSVISHEFSLERFPEALRFAIDNPTEVMKVVIL
jgi:threonine dehydrogenase-like Zn-dependent dehydrogenase